MPSGTVMPLLSRSEDMTIDRLRAHLFGGQKVPFWNYDPHQLSIGLEVEYFIAHVSGQNFTLATKEEYLRVIESLKKDAHYQVHPLPDQPGRISLDTEWGFIAIKPDFAWHILEISLPPRRQLADIRSLLDKVFADVDSALAKENLTRLDLSCLPDVPRSIELLDLHRLEGYCDKVNKKNPFARLKTLFSQLVLQPPMFT